MPYREYKGNIFASKAQVLVNTVNCVGVMGKGVALEFRRRFPRMFEEYKRVCETKQLRPGDILPYRKDTPWILNFAVKNDWRHPSKMEWVESCLRKFVENYRRLSIQSIAMPWIGAMNGRLPWDEVHSMMRSYLSNLPDVDIEVIEFDPTASDPLFEVLKCLVETADFQALAHASNIHVTAAGNIDRAIRHGRAKNLAQVFELEGLGTKSTEHIYNFLRHRVSGSPVNVALQSQLF